jgi:hypothetical protein
MQQVVELDRLREIMLEAPESEAARWIAILGSLALGAIVLWLVRRRALREEYTPIWLALTAGLLLISLRMDILRVLTRAIGGWTPSSTLFFLGEVFLLAICLNFAVRLSRAGVQLKSLGQEMALLRARLDAVAPLGVADREARVPAGRE